MGFDKGIFAVFNWIFFINRSWLIKKQRDELCKFELFFYNNFTVYCIFEMKLLCWLLGIIFGISKFTGID